MDAKQSQKLLKHLRDHDRMTDPLNAINFILWKLKDKLEAHVFLECWSEGNFDEWSEYKTFLGIKEDDENKDAE